jgi:carbamoylphosphate synthase large subunit
VSKTPSSRLRIQQMSLSRPRVLLTDTERWATPARLAIALAEAGAEVTVLCPPRHPILKAKGIKRTLNFNGLNPLNSIQAAIESVAPDIVIPGDDRSVHLVHELHARALSEGRTNVATVIARSLGSPESFPVLSSRYEFLNVAREEGLHVPDTYAIREPSDLVRLKTSAAFPLVMKVDGTSAGRGVRIIHTPEGTDQFFQRARTAHATARTIKRLIVNRDRFFLRPWWLGSQPKVIAQSYVRGYPANCGVACWEGRVLAGINAEAVSAVSSTGPASVVRIISHPAMTLAAERIAKRLHLSGFFGLDFVVEEKTGTAYVIEINPRCTPLSHLRLGKGRDVVAALLREVSGQLIEDLAETKNELIAYYPQAWHSKSELLQSSFHDIPSSEPDYAQELLRLPWPDRSFMFGAYQFLWNRLFESDSAAQDLERIPS